MSGIYAPMLYANLLQLPKNEIWYHEGPNELVHARNWIAKYSLPRYAFIHTYIHTCKHTNIRRARDRLRAARLALATPDQKVNRQAIHQRLQACTILYYAKLY